MTPTTPNTAPDRGEFLQSSSRGTMGAAILDIDARPEDMCPPPVISVGKASRVGVETANACRRTLARKLTGLLPTPTSKACVSVVAPRGWWRSHIWGSTERRKWDPQSLRP